MKGIGRLLRKQRSGDGTAVRAPASHQCYPGSIPGVDTIHVCELSLLSVLNRPFSKMAAKNSNKLKLKTYTSTRKSTFTLVTLQSFSISGVMSAEKM